jgi:hypothetical protein
VATFYVARSEIITPLPWQTFALPFSIRAAQRVLANEGSAQSLISTKRLTYFVKYP